MAYDHAVWRVIETRDIPDDRLTEYQRQHLASIRPDAVARVRSQLKTVTVRPAHITSDDPRARDHDRHLRPNRLGVDWWVYEDEHYPVCAQCGEPLPCREQQARRTAEREIANMGRYETPGVCPCCGEPVTGRQKSITFHTNLEIPGGPPVTFHTRRRCHGDATRYETRWVAADPERRRHTLTCPGFLTNHNDGTYDCTEQAGCAGPDVLHLGGYRSCSCPDCNARGPFDCHPRPGARRNT